MRRLRTSQGQRGAKKPNKPDLTTRSSEAATQLSKHLLSALPDSVILPQNADAFNQSMNSYWAQQECEIVPAFVVRPHNVDQLCTAVTILKCEYNQRKSQDGEKRGNGAGGLFAIRSGGHSPVSRAASIENGVIIDMSLFCDVTPSEDGSSVFIGVGAKWGKVFEDLDAGGRNSAVGVGGLTLGGKVEAISIFISARVLVMVASELQS